MSVKPKVDFNLYLITDRRSLPPGRELVETVRLALSGGVRAVQLREKDLSAAELYPLALQLRRLTREFGAKLLINDRIDVALAVGADGVHLGGHSLPMDVARHILGENKLIAVSTHGAAEVYSPVCAGADFVTFGPVYPTPSKAAFGPPLGLKPLSLLCADAPLPLFALGGVTLEKLPELLAAGCRHVALIGAVSNSSDPAAAAAAFTQRLR